MITTASLPLGCHCTGLTTRKTTFGSRTASVLVRLVRLGFLLLLMGLVFGGWVFMIGPLGNYTESATFDPSWPEKIDVILSGCDVSIAPTDEAEGTISIQYVVWGKSTSYSFNRWAEGAGPGHPNVQSMELTNPTGCEDSADRSCWDLCHATIYAPADTHGFWIRQVVGTSPLHTANGGVRAYCKFLGLNLSLLRRMRMTLPRW